MWSLYLCSSNKKKSKDATYKISFKQHIRNEMAKMKQSDLDKAAKEECLYRNLYAYLEACVRIIFIVPYL